MRNDAGRRSQHGAALLLMMLLVLVATTTILVTRLNVNDIRTRKLVDTQAALAAARGALLDYAALQPDTGDGTPPMLPCPDIDASGGFAEGEAHTAACGSQGETVLGRLPWRTLEIAPPHDSSATCLWYVVSGSWKAAAAATAPLINPDSNGQLQVFDVDSGSIVHGARPDDRPLALIIAPGPAIEGQGRAAPGNGQHCGAGYIAADYLDTDTASGTSNAVVSGAADAIEVFAAAAGAGTRHNDRIAIVSRADIERQLTLRHDFGPTMRALGLAVASCVADYARNNPAGPDDRRLPWPAPLALSDYRPDSAYDDVAGSAISGRLANTVDDSSSVTGNPITRVLDDCDPAAVPAWTAGMQRRWTNWKDHFFFAVAESFAPAAAVPSACTSCLTVNGAGSYAAVVLFAGPRLAALGQRRDAPPADTDTRDRADSYLEGRNAALVPAAAGSLDFESHPPAPTFNDLLFCVDAALGVAEC